MAACSGQRSGPNTLESEHCDADICSEANSHDEQVDVDADFSQLLKLISRRLSSKKQHRHATMATLYLSTSTRGDDDIQMKACKPLCTEAPEAPATKLLLHHQRLSGAGAVSRCRVRLWTTGAPLWAEAGPLLWQGVSSPRAAVKAAEDEITRLGQPHLLHMSPLKVPMRPIP